MNNFFEIDELLEKINKNNNVVICRYSLDTTKLIAIITLNEKVEVIPFKIIYEKGNFLIIHTIDKQLSDKQKIRNSMLINYLSGIISSTYINKYKIGVPDNYHLALDKENNSFSYFEWSISQEQLIKKAKMKKR